MSFYQRFCGLVFILGTLSYIPSSISLLVVPTVLLSGLRLVAYADYNQLRWLLRLALFSLCCNRVNEWIAFLPAGYRFAYRGNLECLWMAPCQYSELFAHSLSDKTFPLLIFLLP